LETMPFAVPDSRERFFAFLNDLFGHSGDGILACDAEHRVIWVNPRLEAFFNRDGKGFTGRMVEEVLQRCLADADGKGTRAEPRKTACGAEEEELFVPGAKGEADRWLRRRSQPISSGAFVGGRIEYFSDITRFKKAELELRRREAFEAIVAKISTRFIELPVSEIDRGIDYALETLGEFAGVDRCHVFRFRAKGEMVSNTHEWCAPGIESARGRRQNMPAGEFPWAVQKIRIRQTLYIPKVSELPEAAGMEKERWEKRGLRSLLGVPLVAGGELVGFLGFESVRREKFWEEKDFLLLEAVGGVIGNSLERQRSEAKLRESEEQYRLLVENQGDLVVKVDREGRFLFVSPSYCALFGFLDEELQAKPCMPLVHPDDREATARALEAAMSPPFKAYLEHRGMTRLGWRWLAWLYTAARDAEGSVTAVIGVGRDITERRRAEEALRESEERFRTLVEQAADAFFIHDDEGNFIDVNRQACESLGYSREELLRLSVKDVDQAYRPDWSGELWAKMPPGAPVTLQGTHRRKDGSTFPVEVRLSLIESRDSRFFFALARDVSERWRAEEALKEALAEAEESRDKIDGILRSVADGVIVTDAAHRVILMNPTAEDFLDVSCATTSGRLLGEAVPIRALRETVKAAFASDKTVNLAEFELPSREKDSLRVIQARTSLVHGKRRKKTGAITILQDITRQREIDRLKSEFISTAAHELRTPLTSIQGFSEVLLEEENLAPDEQRKYISYIHDQARALGKIVGDLLDISRVETGRMLSLQRVARPVGPCIREIEPFLRWQPPSYRFKIELADEYVQWCVDAGKITQVMENLLSNAVKYSPGGGLIRVDGRLQGDSYAVSVCDQGRGMTPDQVTRVFDKFFRADASNTAVGGIGLGMSIVKNIVEAHGGNIEVESKPGRGTTVTFSIPLKR
jgi:PAS domain S-box-containing protein